jgi:hypothetical protein
MVRGSAVSTSAWSCRVSLASASTTRIIAGAGTKRAARAVADEVRMGSRLSHT